jgi:predicted nuclease of restriction endonuclease-like (RecB) superfamily
VVGVRKQRYLRLTCADAAIRVRVNDRKQAQQREVDEQILATLSQTLSWSHIAELLPVKAPLARDFYAEMCRIERWDVRTLRQKIGSMLGSMLLQRTALSKRPKAVISAEISKLRDGQMSPDTVFRDPYLLDLLGFGDDWNAIRIIALSQSNPLKAIAEFVAEALHGRHWARPKPANDDVWDDWADDLMYA